MCYMSDERLGIRELRQHLSVYVGRVQEGERFIVTDHNTPVAELGPLQDESERRWAELRQRLGIIPGEGRIEDLPPPRPYPPGYTGPTVSESLQAERDSYYEEP
jgi:prevent-host-death family protein